MNSKITIGRSHRNLLVGRSSELETLRQLLFVPQRGAKAMLISQKNASAIPLDTLRKPQCMVVMGEAGIGKTRLAEETSREAHERGWAVTWSRSYAQESTIPYRLWIEIMRGLINSDPWPSCQAPQPLPPGNTQGRSSRVCGRRFLNFSSWLSNALLCLLCLTTCNGPILVAVNCSPISCAGCLVSPSSSLARVVKPNWPQSIPCVL